MSWDVCFADIHIYRRPLRTRARIYSIIHVLLTLISWIYAQVKTRILMYPAKIGWGLKVHLYNAGTPYTNQHLVSAF